MRHKAARWIGAAWAATLLAGCGPSESPPAPPFMSFAGLPVRGSLADAHKAGFARCAELARKLRCRREGVMLQGEGPYHAAVDLAGGDGRGGFRELTLWHDRDQYSLYRVRDALRRQGWRSCITGDGRKGDQMIFTRNAAPVRFSMDISYWGKRRMRIIPEAGQARPPC